MSDPPDSSESSGSSTPSGSSERSGSAAPWYVDGLRFDCHGCGACCRVEGYVWVDRKEIREIAAFLDLEPGDFGRHYLRAVGQRTALTEKLDRGCIFWDNGCSIYSVRPTQCRTFPFWTDVVSSPETWRREGETCRGIDQGRLYSIGEIDQLRKGRGEATRPGSASCDDSDGDSKCSRCSEPDK